MLVECDITSCSRLFRRPAKMVFARIVLTFLLLVLSPSWCYVIKSDASSDQRAPDVSTVVFELYTRYDPQRPQILELGKLESLQTSDFNPKIPTKMFAHGWNANTGSAFSTRDAYLAREDCNFIAIDWSVLASGIDYPLIVERDVPRAAEHTGQFVDFLVQNTGANLNSFHLMGHSLGAHVVGGAGPAITSGRLPRITGLDPAGPFFSLNDTDTRLDISDAEFVDIIHTNSGTLLDGELSFLPPIGHIDFYPNGGQFQPGCTANHIESASQGRSGCDHGRAVTYYAESINSETGFRAVECETQTDFEAGLCNNNAVVYMGEPTPSTARGIYYLATNSKSPYALG